MRTLKNLKNIYVFALILLVGYACSSDDDNNNTEPTIDSLYNTAVNNPNNSYSVFIEAVDLVGLDNELKDIGIINKDHTVFMPDNDAFTVLLEGMEGAQSITDVAPALLEEILSLHVIEANITSSEITDGMEVETVGGTMLTINIEDDVVKITDPSGAVITVTQKDIEATNGVIHLVDAVLQPMM